VRGASLNRHTITVAVAWIILTAIGEAIVLSFDFFPVQAAREARVVDDAFRLLIILSIPVLAFVVATLAYSILAFRSRQDPEQDGPPVRTHKGWVTFWFAWTIALTVVVIIHPGFTGLRDIRAGAEEPVDVVVEATGAQWLWQFKYPDLGFTTVNELVLPVGKNIKFDVTSTDVLHSAWVPAFRVKIDAVPGLTTHMYVRTEAAGSFADDYNFRMQCAELCGLSHGAMFARVRVVDEEEFKAWAASKTRAARSAR
jgi:cytochrome c oxidase subunit 2